MGEQVLLSTVSAERKPTTFTVSRIAVLGMWAGAAFVLFAALGVPPVSRTQEARVLETAREMAEEGGSQWLIPQVNGRPRMRKPPLAYWLTATCYRAFGVSEGVGRLPAAACAGMTLFITATLAARLFNRRVAFFTGAAMLGSVLFFRHGRLAETDVLIMVFVTAAIYSLWRACAAWPPSTEGPSDPPGEQLPAAHDIRWFNAAAVSMALATLAKGPPAAFPLLFLLAWCAVERRWRPLWRFIVSGAPLTYLLIAAPWFAFTASDPSAGQLVRDLENSADGGMGHWEWPHVYLYQLAIGTAPWTGFVLAAVALAATRFRSDWRVRGLSLWCLVIFVPLCFWGNKQRHYLLPLLPPLLLLTGRFVDIALSGSSQRITSVANVIARGTFIGCVLIVPTAITTGLLTRGFVTTGDLMVAGLTAIGLSVVFRTSRRACPTASAATFACATIVIMFVIAGLWAPLVPPVNVRVIAEAIKDRYGSAPLAYIRRENLPLVFQMRQIIPVVRSEEALAAMAASQPGLIGIETRSIKRQPATQLLSPEMSFDDGDDNISFIGPIRVTPTTRTSLDTDAEPAEASDERSVISEQVPGGVRTNEGFP
jgi:4-amino-4-deoxy-L-arabinose transferase-like glycosyltransferase